jgi:signal transduction histidine kinase
MTRLIETFKDRYRAFEERQLSKLSPLEREDVIAFDAAAKKRAKPALAAFVVAWVSAALILNMLAPKFRLGEALFITFVVIVAVGFGMISAWFGHSRYKGPLLKAAVITVSLTVVGALVGGFVAIVLGGKGAAGLMPLLEKTGPRLLIGGLIFGFIYAVFMVSIVQYRRSQLLQRNTELEVQTREERLVRQLTDAKLKLMQAQVEPHFLFNTLASVKQLAENRAPEAAALTGNLITFLRAGMLGLRGDQATLGAEVQMAEAYLAIMQTRMGGRLTFSVDVPDDLRQAKLPPAMLISLVENAIKHGLEPSPKGGALHLSARRDGAELEIRVSDTGLGMSDQPGTGVGLANIRERLHALFRDQARLELAENDPHGFQARMILPYEHQ